MQQSLNTNNTHEIIGNYQFVTVQKNHANGSMVLFANKAFHANEIIAPFKPEAIVKLPNYLTIQLNKEQHILLHPTYLQYCNHSCNPNVFFNTQTMQLIALKDIFEGNELRFFYPSSEWDMAQSFDCNCGEKNCLKKIQGAKFIDINILSTYTLTNFIQSMIQ